MKAKTAIQVRPPERRRTDAPSDIAPAQDPKPAGLRRAQITAPAKGQPAASFSPLRDFLGVYVDARTWGAACYILVSLVTGVFYFTWAVIWLSLSIGFLILIVGLPLAFLFLLSVRGLALVEARLVQASLGVPVSAGPLFARAEPKWWDRLKALAIDRSTWSALLYLILQLPLGTIYFCLSVALVSVALGLVSVPFLYLLRPMPPMMIGSQPLLGLPLWFVFLTGLGGFVVLTAALHLIRGIGRWHGKYAQALLAA
jgi:hypothetical protein